MKAKQLFYQPTPSRYYSESFKKMVVDEVQRGNSKDSIKRKYNIGGKTTILNWCRKYGNLNYFGFNRYNNMKTNEDETSRMKQRVSELERALSDAYLKIESQEIMIELAERNLQIDIRKNFGAKQPR